MSSRALIVGAGGVLGAALCAAFRRAGYDVTGLRRAAVHDDCARIVSCDLADPLSTAEVVSSLEREQGFDVAVCNAGQLVVAPFAQLAIEDFEQAWRVSVGTAWATAHALLPAMSARGCGTLIVSGATASVRGGVHFAAFAAAKFALRGLTQALAREYQPAGVHVAHVVLDGILRDSASAVRFEKPAHMCLDPLEVAASYLSIAQQRRGAWTHELDLRPHTERF